LIHASDDEWGHHNKSDHATQDERSAISDRIEQQQAGDNCQNHPDRRKNNPPDAGAVERHYDVLFVQVER
jgi:hypothetical protein